MTRREMIRCVAGSLAAFAIRLPREHKIDPVLLEAAKDHELAVGQFTRVWINGRDVSVKNFAWPNGAIATAFSDEEPDELRGPQHDFAVTNGDGTPCTGWGEDATASWDWGRT